MTNTLFRVWKTQHITTASSEPAEINQQKIVINPLARVKQWMQLIKQLRLVNSGGNSSDMNRYHHINRLDDTRDRSQINDPTIYKTMVQGIFWLGFALCPTWVWAATLQDISFASLPGDQVEVRLSFDSLPPVPKGYTIEQPARIALDLNDVTSALTKKVHPLGFVGNTRSVTVVEVAGRTRVVINLTELSTYKTDVSGNDLLITIGDGKSQDFLTSNTVNTPVPTPNVGLSDASLGEINTETIALINATSGRSNQQNNRSFGEKSILDVDFRRGEEGDGQIIVRLSDATISANVETEGGKIKVEFVNTKLPLDLQRRLDVSDFATPVQAVDVVSEVGKTVLFIEPTGQFDYLAYQADDVFTLNVKPLTQNELERKGAGPFRYKGEKLSLNFQDIEVRSVLQLIADFTNLNLVASDTVNGRITLRLQNVPWDQALDLVLRTKGLDKREMGNVLLVAPAAEIATREKLELENNKQLSELAPLVTEFVRVKYAKASDIVDLLSSQEQGLLSGRGSITVDPRTNIILVQDTNENLAEIRRVLDILDVPVRQVLIEARIVTANSNFSEDLGIRWGGARAKQTGVLTTIGGSQQASIQAGNILVDRQNAQQNGGNANNTDDDLTFPDALAVDLGVPDNNAITIGFGFRSSSTILELELSALETSGFGEVVARPKVVTSDKQTAKISSGVEIPFQEASSSGATSTSFRQAVLALEVTPQITPDDRIIMDLQINQDSVGQIFDAGPSINKNEISTQVLVDNGDTIVLGGIFQNNALQSVTKAPFFGDLPYIGRMFRRTQVMDDKSELLIFITPKIVKEAL